MVDAAQKVVADEVNLLGVEVSFGISTAFESSVLLLLGTLFLAIGWVLVLCGAACIAAAYGLLERLPWARLFTIILGAISLVEVPLGTALGIYTLWVLLPESSDVEYRQLAAQL